MSMHLACLNPAQRAAATTPAPLLVLAGAGSGKTETLIRRVADLILAGEAAGPAALHHLHRQGGRRDAQQARGPARPGADATLGRHLPRRHGPAADRGRRRRAGPAARLRHPRPGRRPGAADAGQRDPGRQGGQPAAGGGVAAEERPGRPSPAGCPAPRRWPGSSRRSWRRRRPCCRPTRRPWRSARRSTSTI